MKAMPWWEAVRVAVRVRHIERVLTSLCLDGDSPWRVLPYGVVDDMVDECIALCRREDVYAETVRLTHEVLRRMGLDPEGEKVKKVEVGAVGHDYEDRFAISASIAHVWLRGATYKEASRIGDVCAKWRVEADVYGRHPFGYAVNPKSLHMFHPLHPMVAVFGDTRDEEDDNVEPLFEVGGEEEAAGGEGKPMDDDAPEGAGRLT